MEHIWKPHGSRGHVSAGDKARSFLCGSQSHLDFFYSFLLVEEGYTAVTECPHGSDAMTAVATAQREGSACTWGILGKSINCVGSGGGASCVPCVIFLIAVAQYLIKVT